MVGVDRMIDLKTMSFVSTYGLILGVLAFLALAGAIIGLLVSRANSTNYLPVAEVSASSK
jgi:hypothetical protein